MKFIVAKERFKQGLCLAGFLTLSFSLYLSAPAEAAEKVKETPVSLEDMWQDKSVSNTDSKNKQPDQKKSKSVDTDTEFKIVMPDKSSAKAEETKDSNPVSQASEESVASKTAQSNEKTAKIKPLCSFDKLNESVLIKSGGWPGVGPFKSDSKTKLTDKYENKLELTADGNNVREASLQLVNRTNKPEDFLSLQMTADFFLEALGALNTKIADFNSSLEEKQSSLQDDGKLTLSAGAYEVSIEKQQSAESDKNNILIHVKNTEVVTAPEEMQESAKKIAEDITKPDAKTDTTNDTATGSTETKPSLVSKPKETKSVLDTPIVYNASKPSSPSTNTLIAAKPGTSTKPVSDKPENDLLRKQFVQVISNWQAVKRRVVKNRQKENLARVLGGKALAKQSRAIKWLLDHHKYYEMTPGSMEVIRYQTVTPNRKFEVVAKINERRRLVDANTMHILKDSQSNSTVSYTVERIRGQWLITDSKVLN